MLKETPSFNVLVIFSIITVFGLMLVPETGEEVGATLRNRTTLVISEYSISIFRSSDLRSLAFYT